MKGMWDGECYERSRGCRSVVGTVASGPNCKQAKIELPMELRIHAGWRSADCVFVVSRLFYVL